MKVVFDDQTFSFELLRTLGYATYGGADIGECLSTAYRIEEGNFESWYEEWYKTAERMYALGVHSMENNNKISAKAFFLRASNYYRTAEFFLHGNPNDPRILATWGKSRAAFRLAFQDDSSVEQIEIPYEGTVLPGYFYRVDEKVRPVLLIHGGFDSTQEELYFEVVVEALKRGYHCMTFEGPGQGAVIREQQLPFRHDWEKVVTPAVDDLLSRPEVDAGRIALMGISIGGLLASRAAAFEHRLAACIANDGLFSYQFGEMSKQQPPASAGAPGSSGGSRPKPGAEASESAEDPAAMEQAFNHMLAAMPTNVRWAIENGLFTFKASSFPELAAKTEPFTLEGIAGLITCPVLVCEAEDDHFFAGQPQQLFDALTGPKTFMRFTAEEGAEEHCHFGALQYFNHRVFEWLDETL